MAGAQEIDADVVAAAFAKVIGGLRQEAHYEEMHSRRYFPGSSVAAGHLSKRDAANKTADTLDYARDRLALLERERG